MRNRLIKKYIVLFMIGVYTLSTFLQSFSFFDFNKVYAKETQLEYTNLIAVFVENDIYDDIKNDIERYAKKYIQGSDSNNRYNAISNSRAIVLPVDTKSILAPEITKILENLYFDGVSGEPSKLVGTILIGDIPLPVINHNGFIYPSIYPYVDFEEQKFIWNDELKYFVYNDKPKGKAEIWHGIINFESVNEYKKYFEKLKEYADNPGDFIGKNIWYDDIIANKQYFYGEAMNSYINNFMFAEDIGYRRYTDLMLALMQGSHNDMISELLQDFGGIDELKATTDSMSTPTMTLERLIKNGYLRSYTNLIGGKQLDNIVKNVETANRWIEVYTGSDGEKQTRTSLDTHYLKIEQKDETLLRMEGGLEPLIIAINNFLEDVVDEKVEQEKYWLNEIIPLTYLKYEGFERFPNLKPVCTWKEYNAYENYFFGANARLINSMEQTSTYRGTFRNFDNISGVTINDIQSSNVPSNDITSLDLNKKSIGGSYDIFATQVDANRGYNINNSVKELNIYNQNKIAQREYWNTACDKKFLGICWRKRRRQADQKPDEHLCVTSDTEKQAGCESPAEFAVRNRGGASPLNLEGMNTRKSGYNFQDAVLPVFDIAGSKALKTQELAANSFEGVNEYSRLIQKTFVPSQEKFYSKNKDKEAADIYGLGYNSSMGEDMKFTNWLPLGNMDNPSWVKTYPMKADFVDFFEKINNPLHVSKWEGDIVKISFTQPGQCVGKGEIWTYRTLDSRVRNNLSTSIQINGTEYKLFQDSMSPVKKLYEGIMDKINRSDDLIENKIKVFDILNTGGIVYNLDILGKKVDSIGKNINDINMYNILNLPNLSNSQIQELADKRSIAFTYQDLDNVKNKSDLIQNQLLDIDGFVESFGFDSITTYIEDELYNFQTNGWDLIILNSWKTNMFSKLVNTKNKFYSMEGMILDTKKQYDNIGNLGTTLSTTLLAKKATINAMITNSSGVALGCNGAYSALCNSIDVVRNNLNNYRTDLNDKIDEITDFDFDDLDLDGSVLSTIKNFNPFNSIGNKIKSSDLNLSLTTIVSKINLLPSSNNEDLTAGIKGMNMTTSDRPIDSPKYLSFKGIGGDNVKLIYPNLYKAEVFSGGSNVLKLKNPDEISLAIKQYLKDTVKKYNQYLLEQANKKDSFYNQNSQAYDLLNIGDPLSNPKNINNNHRPYKLIDEDFLIKELEKGMKNNALFYEQMGGYEPIEFLAHMIYYQNINWQQRSVGKTIQEDMDNIRSDFDVNHKISHIVENYLIKDNNKGDFITPGYRDEGYEVAFINSNGNDYIEYKNEPLFVQNIKSAADNYQTKVAPSTEESLIEEELKNKCNIPEHEGVLLFDLSDMSSPWLNALKCRWDQTKKNPIEFSFDWSSSLGPIFKMGEDGSSWEIISNTFGTDQIQSQYINQLNFMDNTDSNQSVLDNSSPGDYQKLEKIISYTKIESNKESVNVDMASGTINISSNIELGDVDFYIKNIGDNLINLKSDSGWMSGHIAEGKTGFYTGNISFDPFNKKEIEFKIENPVAGLNVIVFYMCLPGTQDINNCVKKSLRLNVIPGKIKNISISSPGSTILKGAKMPIKIIGTDAWGNNVGQLFNEKFEVSVSTGSLSYQSAVGDKMNFSNFNQNDFVLNTNNVKEGSQIRIEVNGNIEGNTGTYAAKIINVVEGNLKAYSGNNILNSLEINLPNENHYSYKDTFDLTQTNLNTIPKIILKLYDNNGQKLNMESIININSKNGLIKAGEIEERSIKKTQNNISFDVTQKRFSQKVNHFIKSGEITVYFMPNFKAGDDVIFISMPGIDTIQIPVKVNPAPASIIEINSKKESISVNSNTEANLKITDNRGNLITKTSEIKLGAIGPISISGLNSSSSIINIKSGVLNFQVNSKEEGGAGFLYASIEGLDLNQQKPGQKTIMVQKKLLPEEKLNIMYLNLFGSDRGNQRGFMSDNNKYVQSLISSSEKLISSTTQLIAQDNIKNFTVIISDGLQILNMDNKDIVLNVDGETRFEVKNLGKINIESKIWNLQELGISEENIEQVLEKLIENKYKNNNVLVYVPEQTDSIIEKNEVKNNAIWINNENVFDINSKKQNILLDIRWSDEKLNGYQKWGVYLNNKKVGDILFVVNKTSDLVIKMESINPKYDSHKVWINGSSNNEGIGFYEINSKFFDSSLGYDSIQNSTDPTLGIGFTSDFKNITNFGAGQSVGESTLHYSSEFMINIGDPLLKRVDDNKTAKMFDTNLNVELDSGFDKGLGEVIYSEPGKTIFKVINIDFNNDGLEDIIVSFTDGTIKILKNYGGNTPFKQLGALMILSDGIKDIIVGDVDGNGYDDIIIWSKSNLLRVYKNNMGVFDVDGYPICINTNVKDGVRSDKPQEIGGVNQIFFEDMDDDGKLDIVSNDKLGYIKIFYGGKINGKDNYVSDDKYSCDDGRYDRQTNGSNTKMVYRFGIRINENTKVLDQSLIRWKGIDLINNNISSKDLGMDESLFDEINMDKNKIKKEDIQKMLGGATSFDTNNAIQEYKSAERFKSANFGKIPFYENYTNESDVNYVEIGCLSGDDPIKVYKQYEDLNGDVLEAGDVVQISVTLKANDIFTGTFIDRISGPWKISLLENGMMEHFRFQSGSINEEKINNELKFHRDMTNSRYMIDNLIMNAGDEIKINYWLVYDGEIDVNNIEILDIEGSNYPKFGGGSGDTLSNYPKDGVLDIKVKPEDGCNKSIFLLFNNKNKWNKDYDLEYVDLTKLLINFSDTNQSNYNNAISDINNALADNAGSDDSPDFSDIAGLGSILESFQSLDMFGDTFDINKILSQGGVNLSSLLNAPSEMIDSLMGDVMGKVDKLMGDMCKGIDLAEYGLGGGNCGLPVPFNQAFLGPGKYHLFGCFDLPFLDNLIGGGVPMLFIPSTLQTPVGPIPSVGPWLGPQKGPDKDNFNIWPGGGTNDSQFRLYVVPTLTAEIGIAMCFGPYTVGAKIPDPASSIGGNCIVTAVPLPCKNEGSGGGPNQTNVVPEALLDLDLCNTQNIPCYIGTGESTSSFEVVSSNNPSVNMTSAVPNGSFAGGFIKIEKTPITEYGYKKAESGVTIDGVDLFGGAESPNKILGSKAQGLIKKVSKDWMDKQINYIMNNLTNFKLDITRPDFDNMFEGMDKGFMKEALNENKKADCLLQKGSWNGESCVISDEQQCKNRGMVWNSSNNSCNKKANPNQNEDALGKMDAWSQNNLLNREQITNLSESSFANPFDSLEAIFKEVPLVNIRTENITVKVPMLSSEDISAYVSMSRNWLDRQEKVLQEWFDFFSMLVGWCGGKKDIKTWKELEESIKELKEKQKDQLEEELGGLQGKIQKIEDKIKNSNNPEEIEDLKKEIESINDRQDMISDIKKQVNAIKDLNKKYNLNDLGNYDLFSSCNFGEYLIRVGHDSSIYGILPNDIYIKYKPGDKNELSMFTKGFDLIGTKEKNKTKISFVENNQKTSNQGLCIKETISGPSNQCIDLFLGGKLDATLNNFLNIQSNSTQLINSVKQNLETLELYKKFPIDLYERMHVGDRYMAEISSLINNFFGTLSLWMKTNANRYSQYVDSIMLIMTTIQTYQAIIDLSVNWSERCSTCTNDNYDQFACKLGMLCPDGALPILEIPPMKIPSIYLDFSNINIGTDIKLPKFNFIPSSVPLPSLPNIPSPPSLDVSLDVEQALSLGIDLIGDVLVKLDLLDASISMPSMPIIPEPPDLPEIPSFIPSMKLELPLLPPAPKIPKLPNEIKGAINTAETIGRILCIVKGNIGLVGEKSIKAKIEQITQRTYEVPYWDSFDQTVSDRNKSSTTKVPDWISDIFTFLKSNEFKDVELKGFDIGVESHVNFQYNFEGFYDFLNSVVGEVNKYSAMPMDWAQNQISESDKWSKDIEARMSACANNPVSEICLGELYEGDIKEIKEKLDSMESDITNIGNNIKKGFNGVKEALQLIAIKENERDILVNENIELEQEMVKIKEDLKDYRGDLDITTNEDRIQKLNEQINKSEQMGINYQKQKIENENKIKIIEKEIDELNNKYGSIIDAYEKYIQSYNQMDEEYNKLMGDLSNKMSEALSKVNNIIGTGNKIMDDATRFDKINKWNNEIQKQMDEFNKKQAIRKEQRKESILNLYKEIDESNYLSYVEYDDEIYQENISILKDSLNTILTKSNNESLNKEVAGHLSLIDLDKKIIPAVDEIKDLESSYNKIVNNMLAQNSDLMEEIEKDYDKFLYAVAKNEVSLVNDNGIEISLSSKLFDLNQNTLETLKQQDNIYKLYYDYNSENVKGYLNALDKNSAIELNMDQEQYEKTKTYLQDIDDKIKIAYDVMSNDKILLSQNNSQSPGIGNSNNGSYVDIAQYINVIKTPEGSINLANKQYVKNFQGKSIMVDINKNGKDDLLLRDNNNVYIKYRDGDDSYDNTDYNDRFYEYKIKSYSDLLKNSEEGFVKIHDIFVKLCDWDREVKNFEYFGGDFDSIRISWTNGNVLGDNPAGYLIKMIHRVDLFNDKEIIVSNKNKDFFDKKYILVLPKGASITGTKIGLEEGIYKIEDLIDNLIFDVAYYNENEKKINITIKDIPRNWQYSQIYTMDMYKDAVYVINSSSSNQIVAGPQIIGDNRGPEAIIELFRPATNNIIATGERFEGYVSTNYIIRANWEDNVSIDKLRITDNDGLIIKEENKVNNKTGYIELTGLFFTGAGSNNYYFVGQDSNGNISSTQVNLSIKIPNIDIIDINQYGSFIENISSPATITAEISHDLDEGYVQFLRNRNGIWETITGTMGGIDIDRYKINPLQTIITGGFYDFGNDIGLYLSNGDLAVKINPKNGKIEKLSGFESIVNVELDYSMKTPTIKVEETNGNVLFLIMFASQELISIDTDLELRELKGDIFGDFNGGKAIIENNEVLMYVGPEGQIYADGMLYGEYSFDQKNDSVVYSFRKELEGDNLGYVKIKIKDLLGE